MVGVVEAVGGVGVAAEEDVRPALADHGEDFGIPAGLALELDALIAGGDFFGDGLHELLGRGLDADGDAAGDDVAGAAEKFGERDSLLLRVEIPDCVFERGLGHAVAADLLEERGACLGRRRYVGAEEARGEFVFGDEPGGVDLLVGEVGMLAGDAFAPGGEAVGFDFDEQDAAAGGDAEAGLEGVGERHLDFAKVDGFDLHEGLRGAVTSE